MWSPPEEPWQYRVLDALPPGVDPEQLAAARKMTPTERIQSMMKIIALGEALRSARERSQAPADR